MKEDKLETGLSADWIDKLTLLETYTTVICLRITICVIP